MAANDGAVRTLPMGHIKPGKIIGWRSLEIALGAKLHAPVERAET
jgi:hypothetical protein